MAVKRFCLFTGNANPALATEIAKVLDTPVANLPSAASASASAEVAPKPPPVMWQRPRAAAGADTGKKPKKKGDDDVIPPNPYR